MKYTPNAIELVPLSSIKPHPDADLVPPMRKDEWDQFYFDISARGIKVPLEILADGTIVDGHHRYRAARQLGLTEVPVIRALLGADSDTVYMLKAAVLRRHLTDDQRSAMAAMWGENHKQPRGQGAENYGKSAARPAEMEDSNTTRQEATSLFKVSRAKFDQARYVGKRDSALLKEVHKGRVKLSRAYSKVKRVTQNEENARKAKDLTPGDYFQLITGDLVEECAKLANGSVDVIITDPPYGADYLSLYDKLREVAKHTLKPGGSLLAMVGQTHLIEILNILSKGLSYHWVIAYMTPGPNSTKVWNKRVYAQWKPVLWFTNGDYAGTWRNDVVISEKQDKEFHDWGQPESGMYDLVTKFSDAGELILDPFSGAGTTGVVAIRAGRKFIGVDIDANAINTSKLRLVKASNDSKIPNRTNS